MSPRRNRRRATANAQSPGINVGTMLAPWTSILDGLQRNNATPIAATVATALSAASGLGDRW
jgi:hypothetical protein